MIQSNKLKSKKTIDVIHVLEMSSLFFISRTVAVVFADREVDEQLSSIGSRVMGVISRAKKCDFGAREKKSDIMTCLLTWRCATREAIKVESGRFKEIDQCLVYASCAILRANPAFPTIVACLLRIRLHWITQ